MRLGVGGATAHQAFSSTDRAGRRDPQQAAFGSLWLSKGIACRFYFKIVVPHKGFVLPSF